MTSRTTYRRSDVGSRNVSSRTKRLTTTARRGMIESRVYVTEPGLATSEGKEKHKHLARGVLCTVNFCPEGDAAISLTVGKSIAPPMISKVLSGLASRCRLRISMAIYAPTECPIRMTFCLAPASTVALPLPLPLLWSPIRAASFPWTKRI